MRCKNLGWKITSFFSIFLFLFFTNSADALVSIEPSSQDLSILSDSYHFVDLTISGVNDVYGFQFDLSYNDNVFDSSVMDNDTISEGTFLNRSGLDKTFCVYPYFTTSGLVDNFACSRTGTTVGVNGSGVISNIKFELESITAFPAISNLVLSRVKISDIDSNPLDNSSQNGQVTVYECLYSRSETDSCIFNDCPGTSTCNSSNEWGVCVPDDPQPETCDDMDEDCDGYVDNAPGSTLDNTLNQSCSVRHQGVCATGIEFCSPGAVWSGCPEPDWEVCDNGVDEDCDGTDPLCQGDVNGDRCVDINDLVAVGLSFGLRTGDPDFDPDADINNDGEVDIFDLVMIGRDFGNGLNC
jgi:hypothetical protein